MQKSYSLTQWSATASAVAYKTAKAVLLQLQLNCLGTTRVIF